MRDKVVLPSHMCSGNFDVVCQDTTGAPLLRLVRRAVQHSVISIRSLMVSLDPLKTREPNHPHLWIIADPGVLEGRHGLVRVAGGRERRRGMQIALIHTCPPAGSSAPLRLTFYWEAFYGYRHQQGRLAEHSRHGGDSDLPLASFAVRKTTGGLSPGRLSPEHAYKRP